MIGIFDKRVNRQRIIKWSPAYFLFFQVYFKRYNLYYQATKIRTGMIVHWVILQNTQPCISRRWGIMGDLLQFTWKSCVYHTKSNSSQAATLWRPFGGPSLPLTFCLCSWCAFSSAFIGSGCRLCSLTGSGSKPGFLIGVLHCGHMMLHASKCQFSSSIK